MSDKLVEELGDRSENKERKNELKEEDGNTLKLQFFIFEFF